MKGGDKLTNIYCLLLIDNNNKKVIKQYLMITAKEVYKIIENTDFKKLNCSFGCYKALNSHEIVKDIIDFI